MFFSRRSPEFLSVHMHFLYLWKVTKTKNVLLWYFIMGVCRKKKRSTTTYKLTKLNFNTFSVLLWQKQPHYLFFVVVDFYRIKGESPLKWHTNKFLTGDMYRWCAVMFWMQSNNSDLEFLKWKYISTITCVFKAFPNIGNLDHFSNDKKREKHL